MNSTVPPCLRRKNAVARDRCNGRARPGPPRRLGSGTIRRLRRALPAKRAPLCPPHTDSSPSLPVFALTIAPAVGFVNCFFPEKPERLKKRKQTAAFSFPDWKNSAVAVRKSRQSEGCAEVLFGYFRKKVSASCSQSGNFSGFLALL